MAGIILPHQQVTGVRKSEISPMPKDSRRPPPACPMLFAEYFVGANP
jgi:hypothetical protein